LQLISKQQITFKEGVIQVPNKPIIGYIEGDGIGADVSPVMKKVIDAVVDKTYDGHQLAYECVCESWIDYLL
jgi:isocitrate dehydrogenase